jgi:ATP-dependent DNA helicase RecG
MIGNRTLALIDDLRALPAETPWAEFKRNNIDPHKLGELVSALSNAARLADKHSAYIVWGIDDATHAVVGTSVTSSMTVQNQPLEFWLAQRLQPGLHLDFQEVSHPEGRLLLLEIPAATHAPVEFDRTAYIRIGSATPRLADYPDRQRALWAKIQPYAWEHGLAMQFVSGDDVLDRIDYSSYFELTGQRLPDNRAGIFERLQQDQLILPDVGGKWNITNLAAILFAKRLDAFSHSIARKAVRFVTYGGNSRAHAITHRFEMQRGYASGFDDLIARIGTLLPTNEHIGRAFREEHPVYPPIAIRELVANALIHQDMTITGAGPLIEMFRDRLEITNPGAPLIDPVRFIDAPPRSRNESLAALMRRMKICEEQGTGIDKVIASIELFQLPPPDFQRHFENEGVRVVLYAPREHNRMSEADRIRACYQHAVLRYLSGESMKNSTLRERFGLSQNSISHVSQIIKKALSQNMIRPADPKHPQAGYVPYWS